MKKAKPLNPKQIQHFKKSVKVQKNGHAFSHLPFDKQQQQQLPGNTEQTMKVAVKQLKSITWISNNGDETDNIKQMICVSQQLEQATETVWTFVKFSEGSITAENIEKKSNNSEPWKATHFRYVQNRIHEIIMQNEMYDEIRLTNLKRSIQRITSAQWRVTNVTQYDNGFVVYINRTSERVPNEEIQPDSILTMFNKPSNTKFANIAKKQNSQTHTKTHNTTQIKSENSNSGNNNSGNSNNNTTYNSENGNNNTYNSENGNSNTYNFKNNNTYSLQNTRHNRNFIGQMAKMDTNNINDNTQRPFQTTNLYGSQQQRFDERNDLRKTQRHEILNNRRQQIINNNSSNNNNNNINNIDDENTSIAETIISNNTQQLINNISQQDNNTQSNLQNNSQNNSQNNDAANTSQNRAQENNINTNINNNNINNIENDINNINNTENDININIDDNHEEHKNESQNDEQQEHEPQNYEPQNNNEQQQHTTPIECKINENNENEFDKINPIIAIQWLKQTITNTQSNTHIDFKEFGVLKQNSAIYNDGTNINAILWSTIYATNHDAGEYDNVINDICTQLPEILQKLKIQNTCTKDIDTSADMDHNTTKISTWIIKMCSNLRLCQSYAIKIANQLRIRWKVTQPIIQCNDTKIKTKCIQLNQAKIREMRTFAYLTQLLSKLLEIQETLHAIKNNIQNIQPNQNTYDNLNYYFHTCINAAPPIQIDEKVKAAIKQSTMRKENIIMDRILNENNLNVKCMRCNKIGHNIYTCQSIQPHNTPKNTCINCDKNAFHWFQDCPEYKCKYCGDKKHHHSICKQRTQNIDVNMHGQNNEQQNSHINSQHNIQQNNHINRQSNIQQNNIQGAGQKYIYKTIKRIPTRPCKHCNGKHWDSECSESTNNTQNNKMEQNATNISKSTQNIPPTPCKYCNGNHWNNECRENIVKNRTRTDISHWKNKNNQFKTQKHHRFNHQSNEHNMNRATNNKYQHPNAPNFRKPNILNKKPNIPNRWQNNQTKMPTKPCKFCNEMHWHNQCPIATEATQNNHIHSDAMSQRNNFTTQHNKFMSQPQRGKRGIKCGGNHWHNQCEAREMQEAYNHTHSQQINQPSQQTDFQSQNNNSPTTQRPWQTFRRNYHATNRNLYRDARHTNFEKRPSFFAPAKNKTHLQLAKLIIHNNKTIFSRKNSNKENIHQQNLQYVTDILKEKVTILTNKQIPLEIIEQIAKGKNFSPYQTNTYNNTHNPLKNSTYNAIQTYNNNIDAKIRNILLEEQIKKK
ncbi:hypothetical protein RFI_37872, partial [Reticulomyxa filosa]